MKFLNYTSFKQYIKHPVLCMSLLFNLVNNSKEMLGVCLRELWLIKDCQLRTATLEYCLNTLK